MPMLSYCNHPAYLPHPGSKGQGGQEGGIRVPSAIVWKDRFPAGAEVSVPTSQMDVFPTLLAAAGIDPPRDRVLDGVDILPLLKEPGSGMVPHRFMFHYCGMWLHAVRYTPGDGKRESERERGREIERF
jgi:arylsulfatase A-like enzyme